MYSYFPSVEDVFKARERLKGVILHTPLQKNLHLSEKYQAEIYLKREDLQLVRSYKIRGSYNKMSGTPLSKLKKGVVCASAGNHAQGVAYSCCRLGIYGKIYMPATTPRQKIERVKMFGKEYVEVIITGNTFDDAYQEAMEVGIKQQKLFIHPFDDPMIIEGQATIGAELLEDFKGVIDYLILPIGGGGLAAGLGAYFHQNGLPTQIIGVEPQGAPAMKRSFEAGCVVELDEIDKFVDGAAVKKVGSRNFNICRKVLSEVALVPEGKVCSAMLELYNMEAIVAEPAGALAVAALDDFSEKIRGKNVVCILSGGNNDIIRTEEIRERSLIYEGLKHYFIVRFPQRAGALKEFVNNVLGPCDDVTYFQYSKKTSREQGPAVVGIELTDKKDLSGLIKRIRQSNIPYEYINENPELFRLLI